MPAKAVNFPTPRSPSAWRVGKLLPLTVVSDQVHWSVFSVAVQSASVTHPPVLAARLLRFTVSRVLAEDLLRLFLRYSTLHMHRHFASSPTETLSGFLHVSLTLLSALRCCHGVSLPRSLILISRLGCALSIYVCVRVPVCVRARLHMRTLRPNPSGQNLSP